MCYGTDPGCEGGCEGGVRDELGYGDATLLHVNIHHNTLSRVDRQIDCLSISLSGWLWTLIVVKLFKVNSAKV